MKENQKSNIITKTRILIKDELDKQSYKTWHERREHNIKRGKYTRIRWRHLHKWGLDEGLTRGWGTGKQQGRKGRAHGKHKQKLCPVVVLIQRTNNETLNTQHKYDGQGRALTFILKLYLYLLIKNWLLN